VSATIEEFRGEHAQIAAALEEVRRLGIGSARGRESLFAARRLLRTTGAAVGRARGGRLR